MPSRYDATYARSLRDPEDFWAEAAAEIHWTRPWSRVLDSSRAPLNRWFTGAETNTCYNALDRHVEAGRGAQPALIYDSRSPARSRPTPTPSCATPPPVAPAPSPPWG